MPEAIEELTLLHDFAIIMAVAGAAIFLFRRINLPPILGYLLAGLLIGPYTIPLIPGLNLASPVSNIESIRLLADLGLVLLLFALGMEFGWQRIRLMGVRVILIGVIEMTFMIAVGYEAGLLLGWSGTEAVFLGAALSISSSAILVKMLRDSGHLFAPHGRLIVGILVVEDFVAVLLLSLLSGVATTGTADLASIGSLVGKLALFLVSVLALGALFAPRIINLVARYRSNEMLLVVSLALCFGLALIAEGLGISAAAGAFVIGTILGDTEHSDSLIHITEPIRDIFAALFFVSIGMLIDISLVADFLVPALVISCVFMIGKVFIDTFATFIAGHLGRTSLQVGMGMPQIGEFSLAMIKVGADHNAVGTFLYPVVTVATAITSLVYPFIYRSAGATADLLERRSPRIVRQYFTNMSGWLISIRGGFELQSDVTRRIRGSIRTIIVNVGIIVVLVTVGTFLVASISDIALLSGLPESLAGLGISAAVIVLSIPSAVFVWRALQNVADLLASALLGGASRPQGFWQQEKLRGLLRDTILVVIIMLLFFWSLPLLSQLLRLGSFSAPVPAVLLVIVTLLAWRRVFVIHQTMQQSFRRTFLGGEESEAEASPKQD